MVSQTFARHIKGGEISYVYLGPGTTPGTETYQVTLRLFLECGATGQQLDPDANIGVFKNGTESSIAGSPFLFPLTSDEFISLTTPNQCIQSPSPVCYRLRTYTRVLELPIEPLGYSFVFQRCCRINGLVNLSPNSNVGSSYTCTMMGKDVLAGGTNSSPSFFIKDTILICQNRPFSLDFSAYDGEGDSLSYEFCDAYTAQGGNGGIINPVPPSQLSFVNYTPGFSGSSPLGPQVTINRKTGLIQGIAPPGGDYVISVCVKEYRNGKLISDHRKDFNLRVDQLCDIASAFLKPEYTNCEDFSFTFNNESPPSPLIHSYLWDFGVANLGNDTSNLPNPTYVYSDTGTYKFKLVINRGEQCPDSSEAILRVYPGFHPGFTITGACIQLPYTFQDTTKARYGVVNEWTWDFGDETSTEDFSFLPSDKWTYKTSGPKQVRFMVRTSKGCADTLYQDLIVREKPIVNLAFRDTLICSIDTLQLRINGNGIYKWSPGYNIENTNISSPYVFPKLTTTYKVDLNDNGCTNTDSVRVRVVDLVTLFAGNDSTICTGDSLILSPQTDGLRFIWTPSNSLSDPGAKNPVAFPSVNTTYRVTATIGKCSKTDDIFIRTVPYPTSIAGVDTTICYDDTIQLHAAIIGSRFSWTPTTSMINPNSLSPHVHPLSNTTYTLTVYDTLGCPKPGISQLMINVRPKINAFAGNDTSVVMDQPLQLSGSGAPLFTWSPSRFLNNYTIGNPIARLTDNYTYILKASTIEGCYALDTINIKVFKTGPDIFVPNAFVPSGRNRILRPIPVGIAKLEYFRVYNRWGQLVFETKNPIHGWDGRLAGNLQPNGTYAWVARGIDYTGAVVIRKGTAVLIR